MNEAKIEASALLLWPPEVKSRLIGKEAGKDRTEKRVIQDEMVGWHHRLNGHGFEQAPGDNEGKEAWRAAVHGVTKVQTGLSD